MPDLLGHVASDHLGAPGFTTAETGPAPTMSAPLMPPAQISQPQPGVLRLTIHEGRNRQVRRMCEAIGHPVTRLVRTRIGPISDRRLAPGAWRPLTTDEVVALARATATAAP